MNLLPMKTKHPLTYQKHASDDKFLMLGLSTGSAKAHGKNKNMFPTTNK